MGWFSDDSDQAQAHNSLDDISPQKHSASTAHELISGAAAYEAAKAWEDHQARNGKPSSHEKAIEITAGFVGAFIDKEAESRGLDAIDGFDREHAKKKAEEQISGSLQNEYQY